jgi:hypothetical protein
MADKNVNLFQFSIIQSTLDQETIIYREKDRISRIKQLVLNLNFPLCGAVVLLQALVLVKSL